MFCIYIYTCVICFAVGESDGYSITSSLSRRSSSARSRAKSASATRPVTAVRQVATPSDDEVRPRTLRPATAVPAKPAVRPPLTQSLFPNIPPTIHFETEGFKSKLKRICQKKMWSCSFYVCNDFSLLGSDAWFNSILKFLMRYYHDFSFIMFMMAHDSYNHVPS